MSEKLTPDREFWDSIRQALLTELDDTPEEDSEGGDMTKQQQPKNESVYDRIRREAREKQEQEHKRKREREEQLKSLKGVA